MPRRAKVEHPDTLRVSYRTIEVSRRELKDSAEAYGRHVPDENKIELDETLEGLEELQTSIHETLHAIFRAYIPAGVVENLRSGIETEEAYTDAAATGLVQVLRDNPEYLAYINKRIEESDD